MSLKAVLGKDSHDSSISLNKYISDSGFCSRREADKYIDQGRVTINDDVAIPGNRVKAGDDVCVDGERVGKKKAVVYLAYNKPVGVTSTTDRKDKTNIIDAIHFPQRIFPVGRLDKDSEGLILLTNEGNIVNKILRAGNAHEKEYVVTVDKPVTHEFITAMQRGVRIIGETTLPCKVQPLGQFGFRITLVQGLNRQIRRMCAAFDYKVKSLRRLRIMNIQLGNLKIGQHRLLSPEEIRDMLKMIGESRSEVLPIQNGQSKASSKISREETSKYFRRESTGRKEVKVKTFKDFREAGKKKKK
ncbi:MAG: 23S rRNA pseudouridine(2604) synthase RluF [Chitinophagaceae bacterium]